MYKSFIPSLAVIGWYSHAGNIYLEQYDTVREAVAEAVRKQEYDLYSYFIGIEDLDGPVPFETIDVLWAEEQKIMAFREAQAEKEKEARRYRIQVQVADFPDYRRGGWAGIGSTVTLEAAQERAAHYTGRLGPARVRILDLHEEL